MSQEVASDETGDVFAGPRPSKPDISTLYDESLEEARELPHRNLAVELLQWLLNGPTRVRPRRNLIQAQSLAEMLEESILR